MVMMQPNTIGLTTMKIKSVNVRAFRIKGLMMGGWFVATAIGNMLVAVGGFLWAGLPLWSVWTVFIVLCLLSALFMFIMMKRLEAVTK